MAKYITSELYNYWNNFFPELLKKTSLDNLWNLVFDNYFDDAAIEIDLKNAKLWFVIKGTDKRNEVVTKRSDIIIEDDECGVKEERLGILLQLAFDKIKTEKLLKKPRKTRAKN